MKTVVALVLIASVVQGALVVIVPAVSHYHEQDALGQHSYAYSGGPSAKQETKTIDGITQGGYSYIDANNILQSVSYVSDPVNGFRVAATNLPQPVAADSFVVSGTAPHESPEVIAAKLSHFAAHAAARASVPLRKRRSIVPFAIISNQYQAQDDLGQYSYGYTDGLSSKAESRSIDGTTNGGYSYIDANGILQNVQYTADSLGFRVAATNLPIPPVAHHIAPYVVGPHGPLETPEVVAAKSAHFAAHAEARARLVHA